MGDATKRDATGSEPEATLLAEAATAVDLALVLAVDCSSSVDDTDFGIQMAGIAAALRHRDLQAAIRQGKYKRIAITVMLWSNEQTRVIAVPWRVLSEAPELEATAREIETVRHNLPPSGTALAAAIDHAAQMLAALPFAAERRTIDVSGDGWENKSGNPAMARDRAVAQGITINGLPLTRGSKLLTAYYKAEVIGGPGAFVEPAETLLQMPDAILKKLLREIQQPVS
jgi:hypothetical protein